MLNETSINPSCPIYIPVESFVPISHQHKEGSGRSGGTIIYVNENILHEVRPVFTNFQVKLSQSCAIEIGGTKIYSMYRSPSQEPPDMLIWTDETTKILQNEKNVIIGDLNLHIDWSELYTNENKYKNILDNIIMENITQHVRGNTFKTSTNTLDVVLTKSKNLIHSTRILKDWNADGVDHYPILAKLFKKTKTLTNAKIYTRKHKNVKSYIKMMSDVDWGKIVLAFGDNLDLLTLNYVGIVNAIDRESYKPIELDKKTQCTEKKFSNTTKVLDKALRKALKRNDSLRLPDLRKKLKNSKQKDKKIWGQKMAKKFQRNRNAVWDELKKTRLRSSTNGGLKLNPEDELTFCPKEKCEILNKQYQRVMTPKVHINTSILNYSDRTILNDLDINAEQVIMQLKRIKNSYARGLDGSYMKMVRDAKHQLKHILVVIFKKIFYQSYIPKIWLNIKVSPLEKKKDLELAKNWRPISVSSSHLKILEAIVGNALNNHLNEYDLIHPMQFGFRRKHSVEDNMNYFIHKVSDMIDLYGHVSVFYADSSAAFDRVCWKILLEKCKNEYKIGGHFLNFIHAWLTGNGNGRKQTVHWNNTKSTFADITSSVIQGSSLGPTLWIMYINSTIKNIEQWKKELQIPEVQVLLFADDLKLIFHGDISKAPKIQILINRITTELDGLYVKFNPEKCSIWCLGKKNPKVIYTMNNPDGSKTELNNVQSERDLGITVSSVGYIWNTHSNKVLQTAKVASISVHKSLIAMDWVTRVQTYFSEVFSRMSFASTVWSKSYLDQTFMDKFNSIYKMCFYNARVPTGKRPPLLPQQIFLQRDLLYLHKIYHGSGPIEKEIIFPPNQLRNDERQRRDGIGEIYVFPESKHQNPLRMGLILNRNIKLWNAIPQCIKDVTDKKLFAMYLNHLVLPEMECEQIREQMMDGSLREEYKRKLEKKQKIMQDLRTKKNAGVPYNTELDDYIFTDEFDCDFVELETEKYLQMNGNGKDISNNIKHATQMSKHYKKTNPAKANGFKRRAEHLKIRKKIIRKKINKIKKSLPAWTCAHAQIQTKSVAVLQIV